MIRNSARQDWQDGEILGDHAMTRRPASRQARRRDPLPIGPLAALWLYVRAWAEDRRREPTDVLVSVVGFVLGALLAIAFLAVVASFADGAVWRVSAFCPCKKCCGPKARGITASGIRADHPLVAAPPEIPFGTVLSVPGYADGRPVRVEDRGGAIQGRRLDVLFYVPGKPLKYSHRKARQWGVRWLEVEVPNP